MKRIKLPRVRVRMTTRRYAVMYIGVGIFAGLAYLPARAHMISQDAWERVVRSPVTLNFLLIFFFWGMLADKISVKRGWGTRSKKSWLLFSIGMVILILFFRAVGGYKTVWG